MSTQITPEPKFCKDCAHFLGPRGKFHECSAPVIESLDLVTGEYRSYCRSMRETDGKCGPEGKLFIPIRDVQSDIATERPLIVYGPVGCGKTLAAYFLAYHFGKKTIVDECSTSMAASLAPDSLALTSSPQVPGAISFGEALIKAGQELLQSQAQPATEAAPGS